MGSGVSAHVETEEGVSGATCGMPYGTHCGKAITPSSKRGKCVSSKDIILLDNIHTLLQLPWMSLGDHWRPGGESHVQTNAGGRLCEPCPSNFGVVKRVK